MEPRTGVEQRWIQQLRRTSKTTSSWACIYCDDRRIFTTADSLWEHALSDHQPKLALNGGQDALENFRKTYEAESALKRPTKDDTQPRKLVLNEANRVLPELPPGQAQSKRPLSTSVPFKPTRTLSTFGTLNLGTPRGSDDVTMRDVSEDEGQTSDQPRKRAAIGDGVSASSNSPLRDQSASPQPRRSKARPNSAPLASESEEFRRHDTFDSSRPNIGKKTLWTPEQGAPLTKSSFDASNIASIQAQKNRAQGHRHQPKTGKAFQASPSIINPRASNQPGTSHFPPQELVSNRMQPALPEEDNYNMILQPETRPISQEQLVAEVKGIYAGLVMVEAKCIEVDNKQATLAQTDSGPHQKLNNEQWQALIALHRTLLHEHHDFFLASQHPSASPALRRLASKYAMPARMWRHGIHSFLELLRHRLPASLDHMLAFIFLAYSMMALLYETVPAFEDTWIECLGDLGRYRMAIEDDDIRDREVWTGVARHWYSKASDKAPTTGRLYHHLAILARPNALQQLFYYSKSLCVAVPFTSARESILTLFEPVFNSNSQGQYRLPPFDTTFVKAHGLLFTGRNVETFEQTVNEFLDLLDNQIGRVTRKFMEQGYYIAVANSVAMLGFASKENVLMLAISKEQENVDSELTVPPAADDTADMVAFKRAALLSNKSLEIVLQRVGDPNVLPFIHVTLVYMLYVSSHPGAMSLVQVDFPWELLSLLLNTLLGAHHAPARIEDNQFPLPEKDDLRPFPEDYAIRGLLWVENYFPIEWFNNEKIDEEEKYREVASMTEQRKERILWLACRIATRGSWIQYSRKGFSVPSAEPSSTIEEIPGIESRTLTSGSETTQGSLDRAATWMTVDTNEEDTSDVERDVISSPTPATEIPAQP